MPFLKHNDPSVQVADANDTSHKCLWVALPNAELNKQLYTCTHTFAEWTGVDPGLGFKYRDMAAWTAEVAGIAADLDRRSYIQWYFGMQDSPGGLEEAFLLAFAHVEKRAYPSEALFVTALIAGAWLQRAEGVRLSAERLAALPSEGRHLPVTGPEDMLAGMLAEHQEISKRAQHADGIDATLIQAMGVEGVIDDGT